MILTGSEIKKEYNNGNIVINPFSIKNLNPNSYNLTLNKELMVYKNNKELDMKQDNEVISFNIDENNGFKLEPGNIYLGRTNEYTETHNLVPMLEGRSSIGRLGICIHVTAGFGDIGFKGHWTLEIFCIHPVVIYPNIEICQIYYHTVKGDITDTYTGKYQNNKGIQSSLMYKEFSNLR